MRSCIRSGRGLVRRYLAKMTGLSRAQITRLVRLYQAGEEVKLKAYRRRRFPQQYTWEDIRLLAEVDEAHEALSGPATQKILQRAFYDFQERQNARLAKLSVAQLYRLRQSRTYRQRRMAYQATRPTKVCIGEQRRPEPGGRPGYLRVDTVHQGDLEGFKGVYHINAVDEVTQWQVVGATEQISEAYLLPVLEVIAIAVSLPASGISLRQRQRVHQSHRVQTAEQVADRADQIATAALQREDFYEGYFNPYLNFHRPCGVPELVVNAKGKTKSCSAWPAVRPGVRVGGQREREDEESVPMVRNALGNPTAVARPGWTPQGRCHPSPSWSSGRAPKPTPRQRRKCRRPSRSCSPASDQSAAHERRMMPPHRVGKTQIKKQEKTVPMKGKTKRQRLRLSRASRWSAPTTTQIKLRKEPWRPVASLPSPGSFLDENMLWVAGRSDPLRPTCERPRNGDRDELAEFV